MAPSFSDYDSKLHGRCQYSLHEELTRYIQQRLYPFHMPGHKGNPEFLPPEPLLSLDVTELNGTDNLHEPTSCILETERRIAELYGADESFLLVNGSTAGLIAAVFAVCGDGDLLAVDRRCHRAVYSGMIFSGARPVYFWPLSMECPDAKAVIVTSPTYEGVTLDIRAIAEAAHNKNALLIVDEAHGAHFPFHSAFPQGALSQGADIVVHSFHKTLPAFSQSAVLHIKGKRVDVNRVRQALSCVQTSSPSYLIMASTDYTLNLLQSKSEYFDKYVESLLAVRKALELPNVPNIDISKLLINKPSGQEWAKSHKLAFEIITPKNILALTSVADTNEGFARLTNAIKGVRGISPLAPDGPVPPDGPAPPEVILTPREAANKKKRKAKLADCVGEVAGGFLAPFPPGIPILAPGERITAAVVVEDCEIEVLLV